MNKRKTIKLWGALQSLTHINSTLSAHNYILLEYHFASSNL
jgi:hypothetical protein